MQRTKSQNPQSLDDEDDTPPPSDELQYEGDSAAGLHTAPPICGIDEEEGHGFPVSNICSAADGGGALAPDVDCFAQTSQ
jgi:hypothetical protein